MEEKIREDMKHWGEDDTIQRLKDNIEKYEIAIHDIANLEGMEDNTELQEIIKDLEDALC